MSKVYGIFYTRSGHVLFGYGGKAGGKPRVGAHLPGGTAKGKTATQEITNEKIRNTLLKELSEEFGVNARGLLEAEIDRFNAKPYSKIMDENNIYIVLCEISDETAAKCIGQVKDAIGATRYDEPFARVAAIHYRLAYEREIDAGNTWFKEAILALGMAYFNGF